VVAWRATGNAGAEGEASGPDSTQRFVPLRFRLGIAVEQFFGESFGAEGFDNAVLSPRPAQEVDLSTPQTAKGKAATSGGRAIHHRLPTDRTGRCETHGEQDKPDVRPTRTQGLRQIRDESPEIAASLSQQEASPVRRPAGRDFAARGARSVHRAGRPNRLSTGQCSGSVPDAPTSSNPSRNSHPNHCFPSHPSSPWTMTCRHHWKTWSRRPQPVCRSRCDSQFDRNPTP